MSRRPLQPCGTPAAYKRHRVRGEQACDACKAAENRAQQQRRGYVAKHVPRAPLQPCGTRAAYERHRTHGEKPCEACKAANSERSRQRRITQDVNG